VLVADAPSTLVIVARFLALLELFREGAVAFDQVTALGELTVRWTGSDSGEVAVDDEFDGSTPDGSPAETPETTPGDGDTPERPGPVDPDAAAADPVGQDGARERVK
jgi:segregation and condensation protein A